MQGEGRDESHELESDAGELYRIKGTDYEEKGRNAIHTA